MPCSQGVGCFDIDAFMTKEGLLLAGRPSDLLGQLHWRNHSAESVEDVTWKQLTSLQMDKSYPLLVDILHAFKAAVSRHSRLLKHPPILLIELKGRAMSHDTLAFIAQRSQLVRQKQQ